MDNVTEIVKLAETRLKEAKVLFDNQLYDGCIYLAGYSVELMLKAKIAQLLDLDDLFVNYENRVTRSFKVHRLQDLAMYAGLHNDISSGNNGTFDSYWSFIITVWSENLRYEKSGTCTQIDASNILTAIQDPQNGVLQWIRTRL